MGKYIFSQGKIRVQEEMALEAEKRRHPFHPTVLLVVEHVSGKDKPSSQEPARKEFIHESP